jgi:hypothetical protein
VAVAVLVRRKMAHPPVTAVAVRTELEKKPAIAVAPSVPAASAVPQPAQEKKTAPAVASGPQLLPEQKTAPAIAAVPQLGSEKKSVPAEVNQRESAPKPEPKANPAETLRKISYNVSFVNQVLQKLQDAVPDGIGFGALSIDTFSTVTGVGTGGTRELVSSLFLNLQRARMKVLGPPDSYIGDNDGNGYSFVFLCRPSFDNVPADSSRTIARLVSKEKLPAVIMAISKIAAKNAISIHKRLSPAAVTRNEGAFVHHSCHLSCSGTYRNFVAFVLDLDKEPMLCVFPTVQIAARVAAVVDISAEVDIITHE